MALILIQKDPANLVPKEATTPQRAEWMNNFAIYDVNADGSKSGPYGPMRTRDEDIRVIASTTYTIQAADDRYRLEFTNAAGCAVTVPAGLAKTFQCSGVARVAAAVSLTAGAGATLVPGAVATSALGATFAIQGTSTADTMEITGAVA